MNLYEILIGRVETLGPIHWKKMFGWICALIGRNFFVGYQVIDENDILLLLILSEEGFKKAIGEGFEKFEFGKTWVEIEVTSEEDLEKVWPFILDAFNFAKQRHSKKKSLSR